MSKLLSLYRQCNVINILKALIYTFKTFLIKKTKNCKYFFILLKITKKWSGIGTWIISRYKVNEAVVNTGLRNHQDFQE